VDQNEPAAPPASDADSSSIVPADTSASLDRQLIERNAAGLYRTTIDGRFLDANKAMARLLDSSVEALIEGGSIGDFLGDPDRDEWISRLRDDGRLDDWLHEVRRPDGSRIWILENCVQVGDGRTGEAFVIGTAVEFTARKHAGDRLERMAYCDALTGIANRRMLVEMAEKAIARINREGGRIALIYIDLVRFKRINDRLGHAAGDTVLREVAQRFSGIVRATDTLARVGGDEFAILLVSAKSLDSVLQPSRKIRECLSRPFHVHGESFYLDARVGIAFHPEHAANVEELLARADLAVYQPASPDVETNIYRPTHAGAGAGLIAADRLRSAFEAGEFRLHFQPIFRLPACSAAGVEGLLRWQQPDGRVIGADQFISIAEQSGLIRSLDRWALRNALEHVRAWPAGPAWVALNLTPSTFDDPEFPEVVRAILDETGVSGEQLALEVTERVTMRDPVGARRVLLALKDLGMRIVIDDFGRGQSSLAYLKDFPIDALKIDRFFVQRLGSDARHERLVGGMIALCERLGVELIAGGVETAEQLEWLEANGCEYAQGFHLFHPVPADKLSPLFLRTAITTSATWTD
jgi:diguanylate cyclase (GGDEF)-like protein/PAS domain S-box-containing protein